MMKRMPVSLFFILALPLLSLQCRAQGPAPAPVVAPAAASAPAPAPASGPPNITKILEKAGQFSVFLRLLKATSVGDQIYNQLNDTRNGMTVFAPTDSAFSGLRSGTLNSLSGQQQVELVQYHVLPTYIATTQFSTVSNPLKTQAGGSDDGEFPLNVTTSGNQVNISTGVDNTTISGTIFSDGQLAVYQVDNVLLPESIFLPKAPAPAPAPSETKPKEKASADAPDDGQAHDSPSAAGRAALAGVASVAGLAAALLSL